MGFHGPSEGVLLKRGSGDSFVDVQQLPHCEAWAKEALGVGAVGIPLPQFANGGSHDRFVVVGQWFQPGDRCQSGSVWVIEKRILHCGIRMTAR